jgi:hypothetical protein
MANKTARRGLECYPGIDVYLSWRNDCFMNKIIYWIPIIGMFVSLANYEKENDMGAFWSYYQAVMLIATIWIITLLTI